MAEAPKGEKRDDKEKDKPEEKPKPEKNTDSVTDAAGIVIVVVIVMGLITALTGYVARTGTFSAANAQNYFRNLIPESVSHFIRQFTAGYIIFASVLCLFFVVGIVYSFIKWRQVEDAWAAVLYPGPVEPEQEEKRNEKWDRVMVHISSSNPSDWRLAILEADIMLDDLLDSLGYYGDTIGDKLKKAVRGDFQTLDAAWEAHKIRNAIAHEGQDFALSDRDAQRVIALYEKVFREFDFI